MNRLEALLAPPTLSSKDMAMHVKMQKAVPREQANSLRAEMLVPEVRLYDELTTLRFRRPGPEEESAAYTAACAALMQVSGLTYTVDTSKAYDQGEAYGDNWFVAASLNRVSIGDINGQAFDPDALYAVITSNANMNGMDSSYMFKQAAEENEKSTVTTAVVRDVIWMYLAEELGNVVSQDYAEAQGRIVIQ